MGTKLPKITGTLAIMAAVLCASSIWLAGCLGSGDMVTATTGGTKESATVQSGDVGGQTGKAITVGEVRIEVKSLAATFQPAQPSDPVSGETPVAPAAGEAFYQAYVRVANASLSPVRVDPLDFGCLIGNQVVPVEPTRSGPSARSLLKNASLDLVLTFKGPAGEEPVLLYRPPWYEGTIRVSRAAETTTSTSK